MGNLFAGITVNWGFSGGDIFKNALFLVGSVAALILLGLAVRHVSDLIALIRTAVSGGGITRWSLRDWVEEYQATSYGRRYQRRGYYHMTQDEIDQQERKRKRLLDTWW